MAISHRTSRLKLKGSPSVEQLQNGRYKLTVECTTINSREDWYSANKTRIFPDFGSLESAVMSIDGLSPRKGEAYADMRLTEVQSGNRPSRTGEDYIVVLTYETLGSAFVQVKDDTFNYVENGLRRVTRQSIAKVGTEFQKTVGTTSITSQIDGETAVTCILANYEVNDTDSYREVTEVYIQAGTLSETEDKVGSQLSIVKETFASTPPAISGYSIANEQESNVDGISTKQFTFLKNNVQLSQSEDKVGSQLSISQQWFNPSEDKTVSGYSLASQNTSDFEGIKTIEYRFLKEDVQLSQSEDEVGSQNSITEEWFKPSASRKTKTNYSLARKEESNVEGIPTERYTFLKNNVVLSASEDRVGSQLAITNEVFKPSNDVFSGKNVSGVALSGYSEASREKSNFEGIPTLRYRFLKNNVVLSETEDKVGSQLSLVKEVFNGTPSTPSGYSIANEQVSDVDGIPTRRFTFLKNNVVLSESEDQVGSQLAIVQEVFNGTPATPNDYLLANTQESDVSGISTKRFTFLKPSILSQSEDKVGSQLAITIETFNETPVTPTDYALANTQESNIEGIPTKRYSFLKSNVELSRTEDKVGSQLSITIEQFDGTPSTPDGYVIASVQSSDLGGIPTKRHIFLKDDVKLSESEDKVGSQLAIAQQWFNPAEDKTVSGYSLASKNTSNFSGIETVEYRFLKDNVVLSETEDKVGSQLAIVKEVFNGTPSTPSGYSIASEQESSVDGIATKRFTFLKPNILSVQQNFNNGQKLVSVQAFSKTSAQVTTALSEVTSDHKLISQRESDFSGIKTSTFEYQLDESFIQDFEANGLFQIPLVELSASDFSTQSIGTLSSTTPTSGLYLAKQKIDNGGAIKVRDSLWIQAGVLSVVTNKDSVTSEVAVNAIKLDAAAVRTAVSEVTANHNLKSQSTEDFAGLNSFRYVFEIRSTSTATELGDAQIGVKFETGIQTNGSSDFIITRQYAISSANTAASIKTLMPPAINDPIFDGTGGTQKAYLVDQEVTPNGLDGAVLTRTFAMLPTHLDEWDEMVIRFPGVNRGPFQLDEGFAFRSEPISEAVPVRMCRDFFLSNPQRICLPDEFRPVDENGNRVTVLTEDTVPTADEYIGFVNSGKYLNDRVSIHRWQGDIWERRIVQFRAQ